MTGFTFTAPVYLVDGPEFDRLVDGFPMEPEDEPLRARFLSQRFTCVIDRTPQSEYLFGLLGVPAETQMIAVVDKPYFADYQRWCISGAVENN